MKTALQLSQFDALCIKLIALFQCVGTVTKTMLWFDSFYVRVCTMPAIYTVGHRLRSTPTNGPRFTALSLPWWSPIYVLTKVDER